MEGFEPSRSRLDKMKLEGLDEEERTAFAVSMFSGLLTLVIIRSIVSLSVIMIMVLWCLIMAFTIEKELKKR